MAENLDLHFMKTVEKTLCDILTRVTQAAARRFFDAAVSRYAHYYLAIHNICDGLWEVFEETITKYVHNTTEDPVIFHGMMSNLPRWIETHVLSINIDAADYNDAINYFNISVAQLITEVQRSLEPIYSDIHKHIKTLWIDQLRSFFVADLVIPAVRDITGYVNEYELDCCHGKNATEWTVLNVLEAMCDGSTTLDSLDHNEKMKIAYTWGFISRSQQDITTEQDGMICQTIDRLFQSYKEIVDKYSLKTDKLIDLIREKQLRNEFAH